MRQKPSIGEYLAFLSIKYEVNPKDFLYALRLAMEKEETKCDKLSIRCRCKIKKKFMFLVLRESEVIAQFPIDEGFLLNESNQLENFTETEKIRKYLERKIRKTPVKNIKDLRSGMTHVNLKVKILEVAEPKHVVTRHGHRARVAKALIADESGTIPLCLWNQQITSVSAGDTVQIENARVSTFKGEKLMNLGKKGTLNNVEILKH